ncbi:hypothetical protein [Ohtaekwangia koreensis]|uniref:Uncharacterized protein n=1 Tax=Ohtaekwangia koreensis TaxID=688867 RepID=A0A1T5KDK3_9BACT|nr:hypothetical protein [Ohtaekwangia koreensis]SKC61776.1 hypothetical protein SAMN05660236_2069 [Ohtaekwangia koreensis]
MDIQAEKLLLIEKLLRIGDAKILEQVRKLLEQSKNPVVGYDVQGNAITHQDFINKVEEAETQYQAGNYKTIDELDKQSETW